MRFTKPEKSKVIQLRVTGEEHRAGYNQLVTLYRVAENSDAIKSLVVHLFHLTGIWGVTHTTWGDFCDEVLHMRRTNAYRLIDEGAISRKLLLGDPFLKSVISQLRLKNTEKVEGLSQNETPFSVLSENLPPVSSRHSVIARDRKLLHAMKGTPESKWVEIADEAARNGPPTRETVKAAVEKIAPKPKPKAASAADDEKQYLSPVGGLRNAIKEILEYFVKLYEMTDGELTKAASSVYPYCRKVSKEAKKFRKAKADAA